MKSKHEPMTSRLASPQPGRTGRTPALLAAAILTVIGVAGSADASNLKSLVGLYTFNNAANLGQDSSGKGNNLILKGHPQAGTGFTGGGLALDGSSYLSTHDGNSPSAFPAYGAAYTIAVTFKTAKATTTQGLIGWGALQPGDNDVSNAVILGQQGGKEEILNTWDGDNLWTGGSTKISADKWYTAVISYDRTSGTRDIWLDGVLVASRGGDKQVGNNDQSSFAIGLTGGMFGGVDNRAFFNGVLDNVAVFNAPLAPSRARVWPADGSFTIHGQWRLLTCFLERASPRRGPGTR